MNKSILLEALARVIGFMEKESLPLYMIGYGLGLLALAKAAEAIFELIGGFL